MAPPGSGDFGRELDVVAHRFGLFDACQAIAIRGNGVLSDLHRIGIHPDRVPLWLVPLAVAAGCHRLFSFFIRERFSDGPAFGKKRETASECQKPVPLTKICLPRNGDSMPLLVISNCRTPRVLDHLVFSITSQTIAKLDTIPVISRIVSMVVLPSGGGSKGTTIVDPATTFELPLFGNDIPLG